MKPSIAMVGLGVMGANIARNMERNGFPVAVFDRNEEARKKFGDKFGSGKFVIASSLEDLVLKMEAPRQIYIMVPAGAPVDAVIDSLLPVVSKGDILIDGGNTFFQETIRREKRCYDAGVRFVGMGISGGEEGALHGASFMPGGPKEAWGLIQPVVEKLAAVADGESCVTYIGPNGAGHFVKMAHNGIEYGDMQLIAEAYNVLKNIAGCTNSELADIFSTWNKGVLSSFLIEITASIFTKKDDQGDGYLVDKILDKAGQKGTGKWTSQVALDLGMPIPTISAAVDARGLSALKKERISASKILKSGAGKVKANKGEFIQAVHDALYAAKIMSYAQGMRMLSEASKEFEWNLQLHEISRIWKAGCIIRAKFLDEIRRAYSSNPSLANLILDPAMKEALDKGIPQLRVVLVEAIQAGIPMPGFAASLNYYDAYRTENLPQNLTQAQRDFFGAHTYERIDKEGSFHSQWQ